MSLLYEGKNIIQRYGSHIALDLPYFFLNKKEMLILSGANGSGKSTLLRLLAFLETPYSGTLHFYGSNINPRQKVTLLLQESYLFNDTIFRNVTLGLLIRGQKKGLKQAYLESMTQVGFSDPEEFALRKTSTLSGGEKQRVALASRLILKPQVLLLDEPTTYIDSISSRRIIEALKTSLAQGTTIVCATHDQLIMAQFETRVLRLTSPSTCPS